MEEQLLGIISTSLKELQSTSYLLFATLLATLVSAYQEEEKIKLAGLEIEKRLSGIFLLGMLCVESFQILRSLNLLNDSIQQIGQQNAAAFLIIRKHIWLFNPFAETDTSISLLTDNIGLALLIIGWWMGFHTSLFLINSSNKLLNSLSKLFSAIYLFLGITNLIIIFDLMNQINTNVISKQVLFFISIPIGAAFFAKTLNNYFRIKQVSASK